jgi:hypothetical protein
MKITYGSLYIKIKHQSPNDTIQYNTIQYNTVGRTIIGNKLCNIPLCIQYKHHSCTSVVTENRVLRTIFGSKRDEMIGV